MSIAFPTCKICGKPHRLGYCAAYELPNPKPPRHDNQAQQAAVEQAAAQERAAPAEVQGRPDETPAQICPRCEHYRAEIEHLKRELWMLQNKANADQALAKSERVARKGSRKEYMRDYMQKRRKR